MYYNNERAIKCLAVAAAICEAFHVIFTYIVEFTGTARHLRLEYIFEGSYIISIALRLAPLVLLLIYLFNHGSTRQFAASVFTAGACVAAVCIYEICHIYIYCVNNDSRFWVTENTAYSLVISLVVVFAGICLLSNNIKKSTVAYPLAVAIVFYVIAFISRCGDNIKSIDLISNDLDIMLDLVLNNIISDLTPLITHILMYICMILITLQIMPSPEMPTSAQSTHAVLPEQRLNKLNELLESGVITQEEYDAKRKEIIDSLQLND